MPVPLLSLNRTMVCKTYKRTFMPKMNKTELGAMGKRIMTKAKAIRKANPRKKWTSCVKEAGKSYRQ